MLLLTYSDFAFLQKLGNSIPPRYARVTSLGLAGISVLAAAASKAGQGIRQNRTISLVKTGVTRRQC